MRELISSTVKEHIYARRFGTVEEISAGIVFLLSPASAFTTGTTLKYYFHLFYLLFRILIIFRIDGGGSLYNPIHPPSIGEQNCIPAFEDIEPVGSILAKSNL